MNKSKSVIETLNSVLDEGEYILDFPIANIRINPQVRRKFKEGKVKEIADSILQHGQLEPIVITFPDDDGMSDLIFGFTRYYAQIENNASTIRAVQRETPDNILVIQMAENMHREDLDIVDTAVGIVTLSKEMKPKAICEQLLVKNAYVSKMLAIGNMPMDLLDKVTPLCNDVETYYLMAQLFKKSPDLAEQIINSAVESNELKRSVVKEALGSLKEKNSNSGGENQSGASGEGKEPTGSGAGTDSNDKNAGKESNETGKEKTKGLNENNTPKPAEIPTSKTNRVFVSFIDDGKPVEGYLLLEKTDPIQPDSVWVSIDGLALEMPLEELKIVRVSYA